MVDALADNTRLPFRVAAFILGVLFALSGRYYLLIEWPGDWIDIGFVVLLILVGFQFVYSSFTGQLHLPFAWSKNRANKQMPLRFLFVEPEPLGSINTGIDLESTRQEQSINPYAPPSIPQKISIVNWPELEGATLQTLSRQFLAGHPFIHYGVVVFLEAGDEEAIHAAIPLSNSSDLLVHRNAHEAVRVVNEFLALLPDARLSVSGRQLVIRMISSYDRIHDEVSHRVVVPWDSIQASREDRPDD